VHVVVDNPTDYPYTAQEVVWLRIAIELCRLQQDIKATLVHGPLTGKRVAK
jgi:hypothetical protein